MFALLLYYGIVIKGTILHKINTIGNFSSIIHKSGGGTIKKIILLVVFVVFIVIVWYKIPYEVDKKYTATTIDGTSVDVLIEMKGYRNFFSPTVFDGKMIVNDNVYKIIESEKNESFLEKFKMKIRSVDNFPIMLNENENGLSMSHEMAQIIWADSKFNELYFVMINKFDGDYFAPANNSLEAKELQNKVYEKMGY